MLAAPGPPAARLLADVAPSAAEELGAVEYASMAVVTLAVPALDVGDSSGFLVPSVDGRRIKASTYSFNKWGWVGAASDLRLLRASIGRHREEASLQASDEELVAHVVADLSLATGQQLRRSTPTSSGGAGRCRSTPSVISTGWPGSARPSTPYPGSRSAGRRTTGSASRP